MAGERLLERIRGAENAPQGSMQEDEAVVELRSITTHLRHLLNARQGSVLIADDYGIPDVFNDSTEDFLQTTKRIERELAAVVTRYEPRLTGVRVVLASKEQEVLRLRFRLEAKLVSNRDIPVVLDTVVSSGGRVSVVD